MSSPMDAASSLMSPTSSFSVLSSVETRSRSSTLSYQNLDASEGTASLSQSFSELSSNVSGGAPHVALSQNVSEDENDDEYILIPTGSNLLRSTSQSQVLAVPGSESTSRMATPFVGHRHPIEHDDENDAEDENEDNSSSADEEEARARQRSVRAQELADGSDSGSDDDVVLATTGGLRNLSIYHETARAASALSVQTLTRPVTATPVPPKHIQLVPSTPAGPAQVPAKPSRTQSQIERRRLKRQRYNERKRELKRQQSLSDSGSSTTGAGHSSEGSVGNSAYDDAVAFITKYLAKPPQQPSTADQLRLLQSLITELGLLSGKATIMPQSIKAAKKMIKQHVHINVKEYLARRTKQVEAVHNGSTTSPTGKKTYSQIGVGVTELKKLMFPSKSALTKSLKSDKKKIMSRQAIKKAGLNVFMVALSH